MEANTVAEPCKPEGGVFVPVIDRKRCEGKEDCARVCPYNVFEIRQLSQDEKRALPFAARIKARVHGNRQAFAVRADMCHGCGLCAAACPERAIRIVRATD